MLAILPDKNLLAGELEDRARELLKDLSLASGRQTELILMDVGSIGPEASLAQVAVYQLLESDNSSEEVRSQAARTLVEMNAESFPTLRKAMAHGRHEVRRSVLLAIVNLEYDLDQLSLSVLPLLNDDEANVRQAARLVLSKLSDLAALETALSSSDKDIAVTAADRIGDLGQRARPLAETLAKTATTHADPDVRERAILALVQVDAADDLVVPTLSLAIRDRKKHGDFCPTSVCQIALEKLVEMGPRAARSAPAVCFLFRDKQGEYTIDACSILGASGHVAAIPFLRSEFERATKEAERASTKEPEGRMFFEDRNIPSTYEATLHRTAATAALAQLDQDRGPWIKSLCEVLNDEVWVVTEEPGAKGAQLNDPRAIAARGLGKAGKGAEVALDALKAAMRTKDDSPTELQLAAAWAIAQLDPMDRDCLAILSMGLRIPRCDSNSPFHSELPKNVVAILGSRADEILLPFGDDLDSTTSNSWYPSDIRFAVELLNAAGPSARERLSLAKFARQVPEIVQNVLDRTAEDREIDLFYLSQDLEDSYPGRRARAAYTIELLGSSASSTVPALEVAAQDERVLVRLRAIGALQQVATASTSTINCLNKLKSDPYRSVREAAAEAIGVLEQRGKNDSK